MTTKNINIKIVLAAVMGIALGAAGGMAVAHSGEQYYASESHSMGDDDMMHGDMMDHDGTAQTGMKGEMDGMMQGLQGKTGDAFDQAFLSEMIVHHQGAVQMAQAALTNAKHQEIKDLAQKIITAQNAEITQMQSWEKTWYGAGN